MLTGFFDKWRIFNSITSGVIVQNAGGNILFANESAKKLLGLKLEDFTEIIEGRSAVRIIHEDGSAFEFQHYFNPETRGTFQPVHNAEAGIVFPGRETRWFLINSRPEIDPETGNATEIISTFIDITAHKNAENGLQRMNRTLKVLSESNQALVRAADEGELLKAICQILVETGGYPMAWVGYAESGGEKRVIPQAVFGFDDGYLDQAAITWNDVERGQGPVGTSIRTGTTAIIRNVQTDPKTFPWRDAAIERGFSSIYALPLKEDDHAFGALAIYGKGSDTFDAEELKLLEELAEDLSYGILSLRAREERRKARAELRSSQQALAANEEKYRSLVEHSSDWIWEIDLKHRLTYSSPRVEDFLGFTVEEILGKTPFELMPAEEAERVKGKLTKIFSAQRAYSLFESALLHKDGSLVLIETNGNPVFDAQGVFCGFRGTNRDVTARRKTEQELKKSLNRLRRSVEETVQAMAKTLEIRDPYTAGHQRRVAQLVEAIGRWMDLPQDQIDGVHLAAVIHDIGKIYTPAEILSKPGKITDIEFTLIKTHPQVGYDILKQVEFPWPVADIVLQHHERMDGSGYPNRLTGENILLEAKILGVADVVEAMSSHRPYRPALGIDKALKEIEDKREILYDPLVVDVCLALFRENSFGFEPQ